MFERCWVGVHGMSWVFNFQLLRPSSKPPMTGLSTLMKLCSSNWKRLSWSSTMPSCLSKLKAYGAGSAPQVKLLCSQHQTCGIPWGTILGSLHFVLYINELPKCFSNSQHRMYDMQSIFASNNITHTEEGLSGDLAKVKKWLITNYLTLNTLKTKFMLIRSRQKLGTFNWSPSLTTKRLLLAVAPWSEVHCRLFVPCRLGELKQNPFSSFWC